MLRLLISNEKMTKSDCYITGRKLVNVLHNTVRFCHMWWTAHGQLSALSLQTITCLRITSEITLTNWEMKSWRSHYTWQLLQLYSSHAVTCQQLTQFHKKGAYQEAVGEEVNTKMTRTSYLTGNHRISQDHLLGWAGSIGKVCVP